MLKGSKKPINSPHQPGHCALCLCLVTYTHTCVLSISYQCFSLCPFFYHISAVVTVGFWLLSIQPPDFLLGIHASCSLGTCGSVGVNSTLNARVCMEEVWLPQTQWLGKGWTHDPSRANEIPGDFCWDFWDKQVLSLTGEEIWTSMHVIFKRKEPNHSKQSWKTERETRYWWRKRN